MRYADDHVTGVPFDVRTQFVVVPIGHWIDAAYGSLAEKSNHTSNCTPFAFCVTL